MVCFRDYNFDNKYSATVGGKRTANAVPSSSLLLTWEPSRVCFWALQEMSKALDSCCAKADLGQIIYYHLFQLMTDFATTFVGDGAGVVPLSIQQPVASPFHSSWLVGLTQGTC